ncbi:MAG: hypothetical protein Fur0037_29110 [Planctomycetota bacterium]
MPSTIPIFFRRAAAAASLTAALGSQGLVFDRRPIPDRALDVALLKVRASIRDGTSTTEIAETIRNRGGRVEEAIWMLPLPRGAAADRFAMTVNGQTVEGEVLDAGRARRVFEEIVRKRRDPGLLEYLGCGMLRARVFPIPPRGEVEVQVRYSEILAESGGITTWRFPIRSAFLDERGPERFSLLVELESKTPIKTVFSPLEGIEISRTGEHRARASLELDGRRVPERDLSLHYGLSEKDFGLHMLAHREGRDGYFAMMLAPKRDWPAQMDIARAINLVLDTSGSMSGEKIEQARGAVRAFLSSLDPKDCFNVIPFSTEARPFFPAPVPATKQNIEEAMARVAEIAARGGTNIEEALRESLVHALPETERDGPRLVPITVFLTDGQPTVGTTNIDRLVEGARKDNSHGARIFVFGVGADVNTRLLDTLAEDGRGARDYVMPGEDIEVKSASLFEKLSGPVMTDVRIAFEGVSALDIEPKTLPDLFKTSVLTIVGRYRGEGRHAIRLTGVVGSERRQYEFEAAFPDQQSGNDWIPALWAQRRVARLLDAIRINGRNPELVQEVTRLGKEFGIVTPYTSHLILEEGQQIARWRGLGGDSIFGLSAGDRDGAERLRREWGRAGFDAASVPNSPPDFETLDRKSLEEAKSAKAKLVSQSAETGAEAVRDSSVLALRRASGYVVRSSPDAAIQMSHHRIGERQFHLVGGVWIDRAFTAEMKQKIRRIEAFSDAYFALLAERPRLARVLAFSTKILVVDGDEVFEIC